MYPPQQQQQQQPNLNGLRQAAYQQAPQPYYGQQQQQDPPGTQQQPEAPPPSEPAMNDSAAALFFPAEVKRVQSTSSVTSATSTDSTKEAKKKRERKHALDELISTECTYRDQLACFVSKLQKPLLKYCEALDNEAGGAASSTLGKTERAQASELNAALKPLPADELLAISRELVDELQGRRENYDDDATVISDIFTKRSERVSDSMTKWYEWHESADATLRRLAQANKQTSLFIEHATSDPRCVDSQVSSFLIAPTQRLVRQMLFLERIQKTTQESHLDYGDIGTAFSAWRDTLDACNKVAGERAMFRRAEAVEGSLDGKPENCVLTSPGRHMIHEGSLFKIGGASVRPDYFFLFETKTTTELLHTGHPDSTGRYAFKRFNHVLHVEDVELANGDDADGLASGTVRRQSLYGLSAASIHRQSSSSRDSNSRVAGGGPPGDDNGICDLILRIVALDPADRKLGYVYSLAGDRESLLHWKSRITGALGKGNAEWKLRFKGDVAVLGEGFASYQIAEIKATERSAFMWFFSGRNGGLIVRATSGTTRSGKLEWKEALRVDAVDGDEVPLHTVRGDSLKKRIKQAGDDVFRICCREKTLIVSSEEKALIVELMKPHRPDLLELGS